VCKRCGKPNDDCDFALCVWCYLEQAEDDVARNIACGGRFYPSVKKEVSNDKVDIKEVASNPIR